eukprot:CAMPEP_0171738862 /NCGR_PEP_ID=MMETSP0991-20121206/33870_1 /TAXON_ID=483369 /ORGANISM="non described non described, Strain CCMP2098" /LENGTH=97 /DNA_ID=CAMNT_0012336329 /DNA_START=42 /DNA_END=335 /DNA_ORIENTATION=-
MITMMVLSPGRTLIVSDAAVAAFNFSTAPASFASHQAEVLPPLLRLTNVGILKASPRKQHSAIVVHIFFQMHVVAAAAAFAPFASLPAAAKGKRAFG